MANKNSLVLFGFRKHLVKITTTGKAGNYIMYYDNSYNVNAVPTLQLQTTF